MIEQKTYENQRRLKGIKVKYPYFFARQCECCGNFFVKENIFMVQRWGVNKTIHNWYYCRNCMQTKEDVLHEIDVDECNFGIAFIDDFYNWSKKDYTRTLISLDRFHQSRKGSAIQKGNNNDNK
jgi:hypothetical protein